MVQFSMNDEWEIEILEKKKNLDTIDVVNQYCSYCLLS